MGKTKQAKRILHGGKTVMKTLVACEFSGIVREAFKRKGHDAWSCDILDTEIPGQHIKDDVLKHLNDGWDMMIAHPPCTYLSNVGVKHLYTNPDRTWLMLDARHFFMKLYKSKINKIAIENPLPHRYAQLPHYDQIIEPRYFNEFGDKRTCLWLKNLPPLMSTCVYPKGERYIMKNGKSNGSKWYMLDTITNGHERSRFWNGIANAMAKQWGEYTS